MDGIVAEYLRQENIPYFDMQAAMYSHMEGNDALHVFCTARCHPCFMRINLSRHQEMGLSGILQVI